MNKKTLIASIAAAATAFCTLAAPFSCDITVTNSKGAEVTVHGEGDEFSAVFETLDGYTVLSNPDTGSYFYAIRSGDALVPSDVEVGMESEGIPSSLEKHLRDTSAAREEEIFNRVDEDESENHTQENWDGLKKLTDEDSDEGTAEDTVEDTVEDGGDNAATKSEPSWWERIVNAILSFFGRGKDAEAPECSVKPLGAAPSSPTLGQVVGLTIIVDFPTKDGKSTEAKTVHPKIGYPEIGELLNSKGKTKFGSGLSVRGFYDQMSHGRLDLTNSVVGYVLMPRPRSYYDKSSVKCGECARKLLADMWTAMKKLPNWNTEIVPTVQNLSYDAKTKKFRSLSVMYAGNYPSAWNYGLWPHKFTAASPSFTMKDGRTRVSFNMYQISPITASPTIAAFCHESGHMVCSFPDLYDYTGASKGVGKFSMMANGSTIDPYLAEAAGWIDAIELPQQGEIALPNDRKTVYKHVNPKNAKEYYLIENLQKKGLDSGLPGSGIAIYRCNRAGNNTQGGGGYRGSGKNRYRRGYELSIVQADGRYDLERNVNYGDPTDLWFEGNGSDGYANEAGDKTVPNLSWNNNTASGLRLSRFSKTGDSMSCWVGPDEPMPQIVAEVDGFEGRHDGKSHRISVKAVEPSKGVKITYCKEENGKYASTNPSYSKVGSYTTWYKCERSGYITAKGSATVVILPKN